VLIAMAAEKTYEPLSQKHSHTYTNSQTLTLSQTVQREKLKIQNIVQTNQIAGMGAWETPNYLESEITKRLHWMGSEILRNYFSSYLFVLLYFNFHKLG